MTEDVAENIRDKDAAVLACISLGDDDIQKITSSTTLSNSEVNYCFQKLKDLGLVTVEKPDGMVERVIDGTRQVFEAPKRAELTEQGEEFLKKQDDDLKNYEDMSHDELVENVRELEDEIESLKRSFRVFKKQVQNQL